VSCTETKADGDACFEVCELADEEVVRDALADAEDAEEALEEEIGDGGIEDVVFELSILPFVTDLNATSGSKAGCTWVITLSAREKTHNLYHTH